MDSFENVKGTITPVSEKYAHLTYFMVQGTQKRLLCISAEDAADPDTKRFCLPLLFQSEGGGAPCYILSLCVYLPFFLLTSGPILAITLGYLHYFGREPYFFLTF